MLGRPSFAEPAANALALVGGKVYPGPKDEPLLDGAIFIDRGKIVAVGPRDKIAIPAGTRTLDCTGLVITAGFQNSHVHFMEAHWNDPAHQPASKLTKQFQSMLTRYGVTTAIDTSSFLDITGTLRRRIEAGEVAGPRILTSGMGIYPADGLPYYVKDYIKTLPADRLKLFPQPRTPEETTQVVQEHLQNGADLIKLFTGAIVTPDKILPMPEPIAAAAVTATHARGKLVFAHPSNLAGFEVALAAKVDVLAHAVEDTRGMTPEHLRRMKEQNMAMVPTLKLFGQDRRLWAILDEVRDYARAGGQILFGTDVGYITDYDPTTEFILMGTAGLSWREILASLTTAPAQRFGEEKRRGRIAPGLDADLVVLARDPVQDLRAFTDVRFTIRAGRVIYQAPGR
jgi:imidazolonepropionase-like amidohydrolase